MHLQPCPYTISPKKAVELYLDSRENELAASTLQSQKYRLSHFIRWCNINDIDNLNHLTGRNIQEYKNWRQADGNLNSVSVKTQIDSVRVFIRFLGSINGVKENLSEKIISPTVGKANRRDVKLDSDGAEKVLTYLSQYEYASTNHVLMALLWRLGYRRGTVRAFDLDDYGRETQWLQANRRPEFDTPLKNNSYGERLISLKEDIYQSFYDYNRDNPHECPDCVSPTPSEEDPLLTISQMMHRQRLSPMDAMSQRLYWISTTTRKETINVEQRRKQLAISN